MTENQKPAQHSGITMLPSQNEIWIVTGPATGTKLTPDEAVALGYALFEHGLFLKGKMKPQGDKL